MPQLFHKSFNVISRLSILGAVVFLATGAGLGAIVYYSPFVRGHKIAKDQPVPFYHEHHVAGLGLDCRFCHWSVDKAAYAGIPPTSVCMTCHSQIFTDVPLLEPVRESFRSGQPIKWVKVHDLADFVYFNHAIHVNKGIGCNECHGRVDKMVVMQQDSTLYMKWCLDCHREPERFVREKDKVYDMAYEKPADQIAFGKKLVEDYHIQNKVNCSTCHH